MDIVLTEAQQMLKASARSFLREACPASSVQQMETDERGYDPELWRQMAELGWLAWPFPARCGGGGLARTVGRLERPEHRGRIAASGMESVMGGCGSSDPLRAQSERHRDFPGGFHEAPSPPRRSRDGFTHKRLARARWV